MHMVSWDKICRPRDLGGLGLYSTKARNLALLAKLNWRVMENPNSLWARTLIAKYCLMALWMGDWELAGVGLVIGKV